MNERNVGRFTVHGRFFRDLRADEGTNLFEGMIVLAVNPNWNSDEREYLAVHRAFRAVDPGEIVPEYNAVFRHENGATSLPEWHEVPPLKEFTREEVSAAVTARLRHDNRFGERPAQDAANAFGAGILEQLKHVNVGGQRGNWWHRLHRQLRQLLRLRVDPDVRDPAARNSVPEGRQRERVGVVGTFQPRQEHHAHGNGVPGQDASGAAIHAGAGDAEGLDPRAFDDPYYRACIDRADADPYHNEAQPHRWEDRF